MPYVLLIVGIVLFIFSILIWNIPILQQLDESIVSGLSMQRHRNLDTLNIGLSYLGGMPFVLFSSTLCCIVLWWYKKYIDIIFIGIGIFGGILLAWLLKWNFSRPRPDSSLHLVESFGSSFPSAHSVYAAACACLVIYLTQHHTRFYFGSALPCCGCWLWAFQECM